MKELSYDIEDWQMHSMDVSSLPSRTCINTRASTLAFRHSLTILSAA